jgi:hypothetical protein
VADRKADALKLTLVRRDRSYRVPPLALASLVVLLLLGAAVAALPSIAESPVTCPFRVVTGLPCATCGTLRAAHLLMRGGLVSAFCLNPLSVALLLLVAPAALVLWFVNRFWGFAIDVIASATERRMAWVLLSVVVLANWVYVLATHR